MDILSLKQKPTLDLDSKVNYTKNSEKLYRKGFEQKQKRLLSLNKSKLLLQYCQNRVNVPIFPINNPTLLEEVVVYDDPINSNNLKFTVNNMDDTKERAENQESEQMGMIMIKVTGFSQPIHSDHSIQSEELNSNNNQASILLSLSNGKYPMEIYNQKRLIESFRLFLEEWILSQNLCPDVNPSILQLTIPIRHALFVGAPLMLKSSEKFKLFLKFATVHWLIDDFIVQSITSGGIPFLSRGFFTDLFKIVRNIMVGEYHTVEAIPYFDIPLFYHCLTALFHVQKEVVEDVSPEIYERHHKPLLQELLGWIDTLKIVSCHYIHQLDIWSVKDNIVTDREQNGQLDQELRRHLSGRGALLEMIQLLSGASLDQSMRESCLLKMYYERGLITHALSMDIFDSYSKSLEDDFNTSLLHFKKLERYLIEDFPGGKNSASRKKIERYVRHFGCFIDGEIRAQVEEWKDMKSTGNFQVIRIK